MQGLIERTRQAEAIEKQLIEKIKELPDREQSDLLLELITRGDVKENENVT